MSIQSRFPNKELSRSRMRERLDDLGMSPNSASEAAGCSRNVIGKFLSGEVTEIRPDTLIKLAQTLQCDHRWLAGINLPSIPAPEPHTPTAIRLQFDALLPVGVASQVLDLIKPYA